MKEYIAPHLQTITVGVRDSFTATTSDDHNVDMDDLFGDSSSDEAGVE